MLTGEDALLDVTATDALLDSTYDEDFDESDKAELEEFMAESEDASEALSNNQPLIDADKATW